jgi:hypothetical protein
VSGAGGPLGLPLTTLGQPTAGSTGGPGQFLGRTDGDGSAHFQRESGGEHGRQQALVEDNIRYEVVIDVATAQVREQRRVLLRASAGLGAGTVMSDRVVQQHGLGTQDRRAPSDGDAG